MKVDRFTASGTFTPPAGVFYAVAHIRAGGGGIGSSSGAGGNSSVAFAGGTITATGGNNFTSSAYTDGRLAGVANSGQGARGSSNRSIGDESYLALSCDGALITAGGAVTPGTTTVISTGAVSATPKLRVANSGATCKKLAANSWIIFGDLS